MSEPLLRLEGVGMSFGGLQALADIDLTLADGELLSVIGPNGAGKSTLFNVISGIYEPTAGSVWVRGDKITRFRPDHMHAKGIGRTFQIARPIGSLSVRDNVLLGAGGHRMRHLTTALRPRTKDVALRDRVDELLDLTDLTGIAHHSASALTPGDQRRLEIARALADEPAVVLLDEPAAGIGADGMRPLADLIRAIRDRGVAVVLVEHYVGLALSLCDRALVLESGRILAQGPPEQVRSDERVIRAYLGTRRSGRKPTSTEEADSE
ncbi:ABC transporter ATP-binding protein [Intrasporangium sp.]|uniref:ABC transporter ATP-binding protein n=1 Tax=Intrasporangium sp. TaxID=1925024 RepID=UPI003221B58A